jgi:membrane protease YdiL (CAAX protease family)
MKLWLSNALSLHRLHGPTAAWLSQAPAPETRPAQAADLVYKPFYGLIALGIVALVIWVGRRISNPSKFRLSNIPGRPNRLTPLHILVPLAVWLASSTAVQMHLSEPWQYAGAVAAQALWLTAGLQVAAAGFRRGIRHGMGLSLRRWKMDTARGVIAYLAVLPICFALLLLTTLLFWLTGHEVRQHEILVALPSVSPSWQAVLFFSTVVMAPLAEEVFFRGLFQSMLRHYGMGPWPAIGVTSAFFALVHVGSEPQAVPALFALSVALGYNYERCGRLYAPVLTHAVFNGVFLVVHLTSAP